jgi:ABC-2 type transport system permease protein
MRYVFVVAAIAHRDLLRFLRDRGRLLASFVFPVIFIGVLGQSLQRNIGEVAGFNFLVFTFTGVLAQTLFQSTASGIISLIEDRENNFSQTMFIAPIPRWTIFVGKMLGESLVSLTQAIGIVFFALVTGIPFTINQLVLTLPCLLIACFLGGAFGLVILSNLSSQRTAAQMFPFFILPQFFLAGVFAPVRDLPPYLLVLSRLAPMTYAVDLVRGVFYANTPEYTSVVLYPPIVNLALIGVMIFLFINVGTYLYVKREREK